jgi:hypothetical protein
VRVEGSNVVAEGQVRLPQQRRLLDEVSQRSFVTPSAQIQTRFVRSCAGVRPGPSLPVCLGAVDGLKQPQSVAPCSSFLDGAPLGAHSISSYPYFFLGLIRSSSPRKRAWTMKRARASSSTRRLPPRRELVAH